MTELNLSLEHVCTGTNSPRNNGLGDGAILNGLNDTVLLNTADFTEQQENLALGLGLEAEQVVNESGTRVTVTTDGHTLVNTIRVLRDDVVQFVGHTTRLGDVANGSLAVELGGNNVVHHTTSVTDLVSTRLNTTNGGRSNDGDALLLGSDHDFTSSLFLVSLEHELKKSRQTYSLRDTLCNNGNRLDLGAFHQLHGGAVDGTRGSKVDDGVNVWVLGHGLGDILVDGEEGLAGTPVHLANELATEGVDDTSHGGSGPLADEVKVQHTLDSSGLHATVGQLLTMAFCANCVVTSDLLYEASCLVVEEGVGERREHTAGGFETSDVVVGRQVIGRAGQRSRTRHDVCTEEKLVSNVQLLKRKRNS